MFTLIRSKSGIYASNKQNISAGLSYIQKIDNEIHISNGVIENYKEIEPYILSGIDLKRQFVELNNENREAFQKSGFYLLDNSIDLQLKNLLKRRDFVELRLQYELNFDAFLKNPSIKTANTFIDSFAIKKSYFENLRNRYQVKIKEISNAETYGPIFSAFLTTPYDEIKLSKLKKYNKIKHIFRIYSPLFITYSQMLAKQDGMLLGDKPCGVQDIIHGAYNQDIKKKDLIQFLFKSYMFDNHKSEVKLLRKYSQKYKNYFYDNTIEIDKKKPLYILEHKSDLMLSKYVISLSINIPMAIIIRSFIYEDKTYKEIISILNDYYKDNKSFFSEFSYYLNIFKGNFGSIYENLDKHLRLLTSLHENFGSEFNYYKLIEKESLISYFDIPFYVYRTDSITQNEGILSKIKEESIFSKLKSKYNVGIKESKETSLINDESDENNVLI